MNEPVVLVQSQGQGLWVRLNRPQAMNSLTPEVLQGIEAALDEAERRADIRSVVVTGIGKAFCAGADLRFIQDQNPSGHTGQFLDQLFKTLNRLDRFPKPVIAALNGLALAGGLELLLCCDLVVAARSARMGDAHANYGLIPGGGGSVRLPRAIGATRAKYLMLTGDFVSTQAMQEAGLVHQVVDDADLTEAALSLADKLAHKSPLGLKRMLALVDSGLESPIDDALCHELQVLQEHAKSDDMQEGLAAFAEKRPPVFTGR